MIVVFKQTTTVILRDDLISKESNENCVQFVVMTVIIVGDDDVSFKTPKQFEFFY